MNITRVSLKTTISPELHHPAASFVPVQPLLAAHPELMLGSERIPPLASHGVIPAADTCFGPRGAALLGENGPLIICDTGHHRLLGWNTLPTVDRQAADWLIGHPGFDGEGRNAKGPVSASTLNVPTGICAYGEHGLAVADAWNHRILLWDDAPARSHTPADRVLGQTGFQANLANHGLTATASAGSLHWPYGVHVADGRIFVADTGNRRVLIWNTLDVINGQPADVVLGQYDFHARHENAGSSPDTMSMRWPHGIALWQGRLCVSDAGNNRIMVWDGIPLRHGEPCQWLLGQDTPTRTEHNQSLYWPRNNTLNMPYAITAAGDWLLAADTANSRLLGWHIDDLENGAPARALSGQPDFHSKGDNRWQAPTDDSFCWPYGIQQLHGRVVVADSGNNRVSIWRLTMDAGGSTS